MEWFDIGRWIMLSVQLIGLVVQLYFARKAVGNWTKSEEDYEESFAWLEKCKELYIRAKSEVNQNGD